MMVGTVEQVSGGDFRIERLESGALVPGHAGHDPASGGTIDAADGPAGVNVNKTVCHAFIASAPFEPRAGNEGTRRIWVSQSEFHAGCAVRKEDGYLK